MQPASARIIGKRIREQLGLDGALPVQYARCEVAVSGLVAEGIVDFAVREGVDLIGMYTHDRKGLSKLTRGSISKKVQRRAPVEVQVFRPSELVAR